jgi:hypothetical protein
MKTTTQAIIAQAKAKMAIIETGTSDWTKLAIEHRNDLLDEYRRAEQTIEALAEARKDYR